MYITYHFSVGSLVGLDAMVRGQVTGGGGVGRAANARLIVSSCGSSHGTSQTINKQDCKPTEWYTCATAACIESPQRALLCCSACQQWATAEGGFGGSVVALCQQLQHRWRLRRVVMGHSTTQRIVRLK